MLSAPKQQEIDHRTLKLMVGVVAISLAFLTGMFSSAGLASISESYYEDGWSRTIFIGFLFAIASFLLAHNGKTTTEMVLSKIAAAAGFGVALFPCDCGHDPEVVPYLHGLSAATMFVVLAYFCLAFYRRTKTKNHPRAKARGVIYIACGLVIVASILALAIDFFLDHRFSTGTSFIFWGEAVALVAFGTAWLLASKVLPWLTEEAERFSPLREHNPPA